MVFCRTANIFFGVIFAAPDCVDNSAANIERDRSRAKPMATNTTKRSVVCLNYEMCNLARTSFSHNRSPVITTHDGASEAYLNYTRNARAHGTVHFVVGRTGNDPVLRVLKGRRAANYTNDPALEAPVRLSLAGRVGFEPTTMRLTAACSASELPSREYAAAAPSDAAVRFSGPLSAGNIVHHHKSS